MKLYVSGRLAAPAWLLAAMLLGCDEPVESDDGTPIEVEFVAGEDREPILDGDPLLVELRPQGVFGATVDMNVAGVQVDSVPGFTLQVADPSGRILASQRFLSTSTGEMLDTGEVALSGLPIVFSDQVAQAEVDQAEAELSVVMESSPPSQASVAVVLVVNAQ